MFTRRTSSCFQGATNRRRGRRRFAALASTTLVVCAILIPPPTAEAGFGDAQAILTGGTLGGTRGLRVRRVGAPTAAYSWNASYQYYPASSIKVLEHLYSMVLVDDGIWDLITTTPDICTTDTNCGTAPNNVSGCGAQSWPLEDVLEDMMTISSNEATNAIQEEVGRTFFPQNNFNYSAFGRLLMTSFAQNTVGMPDTELNHKLGCGGPCDNPSPNILTLIDIEELYRDVAVNTSLLSVPRRIEMHDLMLNESNSFLNGVIGQEAAATGKNAYLNQFTAATFMVYKDGSYTCSGNTYLSSSGLLQLPTYNGAYKRLYTWGVMVDETEDWAYIPGTMSATKQELLRYAVRAALLTWGNNYLVLDLAGDAGDAVEQLPLYNDPGPIGALLQSASRHIRLAEVDLDQVERDYAAAIAKLALAVDDLLAAQGIDPGAVPDALITDIVDLSLAGVVDAISMIAMTSDASQVATVIGNMEAYLATARQYLAAGDESRAMTAASSAAGLSGGMILWSSRGPAADDDNTGYTGSAPDSLIFRDGFESEDVAAWSSWLP